MYLINAIQDLAVDNEELEEPFLLLEGMYAAWTPHYVDSLITERMKLAMGGLEYLDLISGKQVVVFTRARSKRPLSTSAGVIDMAYLHPRVPFLPLVDKR